MNQKLLVWLQQKKQQKQTHSNNNKKILPSTYPKIALPPLNKSTPQKFSKYLSIINIFKNQIVIKKSHSSSGGWDFPSQRRKKDISS